MQTGTKCIKQKTLIMKRGFLQRNLTSEKYNNKMINSSVTVRVFDGSILSQFSVNSQSILSQLVLAKYYVH